MWVDLWEWTQSEGFCLFIKRPRRQDDLVSWYQPVFLLPFQSLDNRVGTVAVMAAKHGPISQCFTDVHIAMAKCLTFQQQKPTPGPQYGTIPWGYQPFTLCQNDYMTPSLWQCQLFILTHMLSMDLPWVAHKVSGSTSIWGFTEHLL